MEITLFRGFNPLAWLVFLTMVLATARPAQATHLIGGEMTYRYLDATGPATAPHRYELTLTVYNTCGAAAIRPTATIGIYEQATGNQVTLTTTNYANANYGNLIIPQTSIGACTTPYVPPGCTILGASQSYQLQKFVGIVSLPATTSGYYALWTDGNRNLGITNLTSPSDDEFMTLYATLAPPTRANSSPVFVDKAVANLCINDTTYLLNNATDADGDRLEYSLVQPYGNNSTYPPGSFLPAPTLVPYAAAQYTGTTPLGTAAGNYASINPNTGIAKYRTTAPLNSKFVVAIDVKEYRVIAGVEQLIGVTRRDLQLVVVSCPNVLPPVLPTATSTPIPRAYTVEAGSTLSIPLTVTQVDGHPLTLSVSSVLLDGAGGYNATLSGNPGTVVAGNPSGTAATPSTVSPVSGTFVYVAGCNDARATPYDVTLVAKDDGCSGKTVGDVLRVTVVKPTGPTAIAGNLAVCGLNTVQSYTASGGTTPSVSWTVTGGTIVGSSMANPVQVSWPTAGTGTVAVQGITQNGCPTGQVVKTVTISPASALVVTGSQAICQGGSTTLAVAGGTAPYTLTGGATPVSGAGPFVLSPTQTTTYTIAGTVVGSACPATTQVTITVNPASVASAGAPVSICSGGTAQLGAAAVAGTTYSWSPATGLSSATVANPTVTLTNTTGAPVTQTYTLTVTGTGSCTGTSTVAVTTYPQPVANAGAATSFCSGGTAQLGTAPVSGFTYSWSPTTGLSNPAIANPSVTLTNATSGAITQTYTLTVTGTGNCSATSTVVVTVNPMSTVTAGAPVSFCSGGTAQLGAAAAAGVAYSWSPATGLSSATVANPTVTLTNTTGAPITQTYTLTASSTNASCVSTSTVVVTVQPKPVADAGAAVSICSGGTTQLGAAAVAGFTYSWSPATGLNSASIANPSVTLTNATGGVITQTYTLTVTGTGNCSATGTVVVTVNPQSVATAGAAVAFCSGGTAQLGAAAVAGTTYSWSPATGLSSATVANPTVTLTNTTGAPITQTYTLTATSSAGGCASTGTVVVTVNPLPVANAGAAVALCSGGMAQLGAAAVAGNSYSWSPATGLSSATVANPTVTLTNTTGAPVTQTYTLTMTSAGSCTSISTVVVTTNPQSVTNAGGAATFCSGGTAQLGTAPVSGVTYSWSPATGLSSATVANPTVTLTNTTGAPITQTYILTASSSNASCVSTSTVAVTVQPKPVADAGAAVSICSGGTTQLGAAAVAGFTYSWSPATGLSSATVANPTVTLTNPTGAPITQTYTLTVTGAGSCASTSTVAVTVNSPVVISAGTPVAFCSGGSAQLGAASVVGSTYSWSPATGLSSITVANPTVTLTNTTGAVLTQTYTLTVTNPSTGCTSTATVAVTVNPLPTANAGPAVALCSGAMAQVGASPVAGVAYSWSPATGLSSSTVANPSISLPNTTGAPITQTYTLTATNSATGCVSRGTVVVTVSPLPVAAPGIGLTICSGATAQLGAAPVAGLNYSWSPAAGLSSATVANPTVTLTNPTAAATTQTYTLTVTNAATACTSTGTVAVTVTPAVVPGTIGADQTVCAGAVPAPLTSLAAASGGPGTYAYQWESSPDNVTWKAVANVTSLSYAPSAVPVTTYFRRRVTGGACGMAYTNVVTVHVQQLLIPTVALPTLPAQCAGTAIVLAPVPASAGAAPTYRWFVNNTMVGTSTVFTSTTLADGDIVQVELTPTAGFCATGTAIATTRVSLTPVPLPMLAIVAQTTFPVCLGAPVSFALGQATNVGTNPQYQWQVDGVAVNGATKTIFTSTTLRDGQAVTLVIRTTNACGQPATAMSNAVRVTVNPPVHVAAGPDKTITEGESVTLEGTADGTYPVTWTPAQTLTFANGDQLHPVATPTTTTTYVLSAGAGYCADQSSVTITVLKRVRIPSAFSPNADNNDDTWQIAGIEDYPANHVEIFNRWGAKLFEASGYSRSTEWNGLYKGEPLPIGTYYYLVTLGNGKSYSGPVTVIY